MPKKIAKIQTKTLKVEDIKKNPRNPKNHWVAGISESIKKRGYADPIIVDENNMIVAGHGRLQSMKELGYETVDVVIVKGWSDKDKEEHLIASNKIEERGGWDREGLKAFDDDILSSAGFDSDEIDAIFEGEENEDSFKLEDELEKAGKPTSKRGEIYELGEHRLMCGDSTSEADVCKLLESVGKAKADMVFTDPPYNVDYKGRGKKTSSGIMGDKQSEEKFVEFCDAWVKNMKRVLKLGGVFYICSGYSSFPTFIYTLRENGLYFSQPIIWVKNNTSMGWNDYRYKHEMIIKNKNNPKKRKKQAVPILYGWKKGTHYFTDTKFEADVWQVKRRASNTMVHPTQKPIELPARAIRNSTIRGQVVLDLFGGSGSTLMAAEQEGRIACLIDLDPKFCDIIRKRWQHLKG